MMAEKLETIAIGFPIAEGQRQLLRKALPPGHRLPALYREGADVRPCCDCGMKLNIGPRVLVMVNAGIPLYCLICARFKMQEAGTTGLDVLNLGNPDSCFESD